MKIKAVFVDFDGTLYSHKTDHIPDSALKAINAMRSNGIKVYLCSGRAPIELTWFDLKDLKLDGYVYNNGQLVVDDKNEIIFAQPLEGILKDILVKIFNEKLLPVYFANIDDIYLNYDDGRVAECQKKVGSEVPHFGTYNGENIYMCSAFLTNEEELDQYHIKEYGEVTYWQEGAVDICPKNVSKVTGIKAILKREGFSLEETMGIGDGHNDIEMLKACGIGVCMANGKDEVKKISDYVTTDIDEDGLINACRYFNLI